MVSLDSLFKPLNSGYKAVNPTQPPPNGKAYAVNVETFLQHSSLGNNSVKKIC
jgi:hypothetical protein